MYIFGFAIKNGIRLLPPKVSVSEYGDFQIPAYATSDFKNRGDGCYSSLNRTLATTFIGRSWHTLR